MYEGITLVEPWPIMMILKGGMEEEEGGGGGKKAEARVRRYC